MRKPAFVEIGEILESTGMSESDVAHLLARFLEEEAKHFVECMELVEDKCEEQTYFA